MASSDLAGAKATDRLLSPRTGTLQSGHTTGLNTLKYDPESQVRPAATRLRPAVCWPGVERSTTATFLQTSARCGPHAPRHALNRWSLVRYGMVDRSSLSDSHSTHHLVGCTIGLSQIPSAVAARLVGKRPRSVTLQRKHAMRQRWQDLPALRAQPALSQRQAVERPGAAAKASVQLRDAS